MTRVPVWGIVPVAATVRVFGWRMPALIEGPLLTVCWWTTATELLRVAVFGDTPVFLRQGMQRACRGAAVII